MRRARAALLVTLAAACASCAIISAGDYVGSGETAEAGLDAGPPPASEDAEAGDAAAAPPPSVILSGAVPFATGRAQQSHLFYSRAAARWVFFTFDNTSTKRLSTRLSADFTTWTDGPTLELPQEHERDGRDLAVAALPAASNAFHLSLSLIAGSVHSHHHVRAVLGDALAFEPLVELGDTSVNQIGISPDGPAVVATSTGRIVDLSGWATPPDGGYGNGNLIPWVSTVADNGTAWPPAFTAPFQLDTVGQACNARALVATAQGAVAVWESADAEPLPHALRTSTFDGNGWSDPGDVGFERATFDVNDWSMAAVGSAIHVVRRGDSYSHRILANGNFGPGSAMVAGNHAAGAGVVLLVDHGILRAYTLDPDGAILTASLETSWSAWTELLPRGSARASLTGFAGDGVTALAWVEEKPSGLAVVGWRAH